MRSARGSGPRSSGVSRMDDEGVLAGVTVGADVATDSVRAAFELCQRHLVAHRDACVVPEADLAGVVALADDAEKRDRVADIPREGDADPARRRRLFEDEHLGVALDEQRVLESTRLPAGGANVGGIGTPAASHSSM